MTVFIDTDGEMTFENKERLNFIMHFMKQGATEQVSTKKDGTFVRDDAEISFNEIWLPCAIMKQKEIASMGKGLGNLGRHLKEVRLKNKKLKNQIKELTKEKEA